jgi:hypothetical protein
MDWPAFLTDHSIEYVTSGSNTRKGQISIKCPYCGNDDPSEHLSISLTKDAFGCWRNAEHAGRKPYSLVAALLGCSFAQARLIVSQYDAADPGALGDALTLFESASEARKAVTGPLKLAPEFRPITPQGNAKRFWHYLEGRGFDDVTRLAAEYGLLCCHSGQYKDRIIIPLYDDGQLLGWTGRAIQNVVLAPRYLSTGPAITETIYNLDQLTGADCLCITEGPFDALKVDYYGKKHGIRATCLFGVNATMSQIGLLRSVTPRFKQVKLLFDQDAVGPMFQIIDWLSAPNVVIGHLPQGVTDPGNLTAKQVLAL